MTKGGITDVTEWMDDEKKMDLTNMDYDRSVIIVRHNKLSWKRNV